MKIVDATRRFPLEQPLAELAEHCLAAREIIDAIGDPAMRLAVDVLLVEVGRALAHAAGPDEADAA